MLARGGTVAQPSHQWSVRGGGDGDAAPPDPAQPQAEAEFLPMEHSSRSSGSAPVQSGFHWESRDRPQAGGSPYSGRSRRTSSLWAPGTAAPSASWAVSAARCHDADAGALERDKVIHSSFSGLEKEDRKTMNAIPDILSKWLMIYFRNLPQMNFGRE